MTEHAAGTPSTTHEPTQAEAVAVGTAGANAVNPETQSPAEAREAAREAMAEQSRRLEIRLAPDALDQMADAFIAKLEAMGAFRRGNETSETENAETENTESTAATENNDPPTKRTLADRFLGGK